MTNITIGLSLKQPESCPLDYVSLYIKRSENKQRINSKSHWKCKSCFLMYHQHSRSVEKQPFYNEKYILCVRKESGNEKL
ncbi:CLUMA_CG001727, isoform A [Clunio marinus]|uniref:CLUMA_CG001727, isoform A n=1 Tax=Clunio marinus TaxID=568069 RepID=A0A1J1HIV1_9DIPT|nr:CLUMA_CG001727, isoform A [Clunio marinus]